ncbi:hypothetical protein INR49_030686 [Caranx melampygus]|nr:hypothetical protein INR49_030686 [Caranx melampygus]
MFRFTVNILEKECVSTWGRFKDYEHHPSECDSQATSYMMQSQIPLHAARQELYGETRGRAEENP